MEGGAGWDLACYPKITSGSDWASPIPKRTLCKQVHRESNSQKFLSFKLSLVYVLEKVHGSCFCLSTDGTIIKVAKRNAWIENDDTTYFDFSNVRKQYDEAIMKLHALLSHGDGPARKLFVYGELYGGDVQSELFYRTEIEFLAFDILYDGVFLDYKEALNLFEQVGLPCMKPLFEGPLNKCFDFPVDFSSEVSQGKVPAEGYIVKAVKELSIKDTRGRTVRAVAKRKSLKFAEKVSAGVTVKGRERQALQGWVTDGRLCNVLSKEGRRKPAPEELAEKLAKDAAEEAREDAVLRAWFETGAGTWKDALPEARKAVARRKAK